MHTSSNYLPDAFEVGVEGRGQLPRVESAEFGVQLPIFGDEYTGQLSLPLDDNKGKEE